jgi:mono/diheme cytochrome c family protein
MRLIPSIVITAILTTPTAAAEKPVHLKAGAGLDKVEANCGACHSSITYR